MKISAAVKYSGQPAFVIEEVELEAPRDDEILVRVVGVGLCHTDLVFAEREDAYPFPAVFGHEGSGIVEAVGKNVTKVKSGDRVTMTFRACGDCDRIEGDSNPDEFIPELIEHYRAGRLPFDKLIKTYPLSEINQAIADQHAGKCVKVVLLPGDGGIVG
jgi:Zn-dependent alcohol dehydrogenase